MSVYENLKKLNLEIPEAPNPVGAYIAFKKKDGSPNALGKFYNTKTLKDLIN